MSVMRKAASNQWVLNREPEDEEIPDSPVRAIDTEPRLSDLVGPPPDWVRKEPEHAAVLEGARELRRQLIAAQEERDEAWGEAELMASRELLIRQIFGMSRDEVRMVSLLVEKVMGEGRKEYGPLDLSTDSRTADDFRAERNDELRDTLSYELIRLLLEHG